jgi:hypothetical protein
MEIRRIIRSEIHEQQFVELREVDGQRRFTMVVGQFEATSLDRRVKRLPFSRPLTHDLLLSVIEQLGGELTEVVISELKEGTYFAKLMVATDDDEVEIDCRPSDAFPLAVSADVPILVEESVLEEVSGE